MNEIVTSSLEFSTTSNETSGFETLFTVMSVSMWTLGLTSILMNVLFLVAVRSMRKVATTSDCLMQNMSVADGLSALLFLLNQHYHPSSMDGDEGSTFSCEQSLWYTMRGTPWMFFTGYLLTLMCLGISQYLAVCQPSK